MMVKIIFINIGTGIDNKEDIKRKLVTLTFKQKGEKE